MKLAGKDIRRLQARTELGLTVTRGGKDHAGILRLAVIRVHEVHVFTITDVLKQRVLPHSLDVRLQPSGKSHEAKIAATRRESFEVFSAKLKRGAKKPTMQDSLRLTLRAKMAL